jgi:hypothetical protein
MYACARPIAAAICVGRRIVPLASFVLFSV